MSPRNRVIFLVLLMTVTVIGVELVTIVFLYQTAFEEEQVRLIELAKSQARLIESVARFDQEQSTDYKSGARQATLDQIRDSHSRYRGFGKTGEFTLAEKRDNLIVFILSHRHFDLDHPKPVLWDSGLAEPMKMALSGKSGAIIGIDYRGEKVLAAHEPVQVLNLGIVAKMDLSEIKAPFFRAAIFSTLVAFFLIALGVTFFFKLTNPLIDQLNATVGQLLHSMSEIKTLRGILPICSYCKKIRDDEGYWTQVEDYVHERSDADFSHSICPACMEQHYSKDLNILKKHQQK